MVEKTGLPGKTLTNPEFESGHFAIDTSNILDIHVNAQLSLFDGI